MSYSISESTLAMIDDSYRAVSSCDKPAHFHQWPITGELEIERCEHYCLYCRGPKALKKWSSAWFLRRHVRETHAKIEFPGLTVSEGWSKCPNGNARPICKKQRAPGSNKKRSGTKKERANMMMAFENYNVHTGMPGTAFVNQQFSESTCISPKMPQAKNSIVPYFKAPAPTGFMSGSTDPAAYLPTSPATDFDFNAWTSTASPQHELGSFEPEKLEPFIELDSPSSFDVEIFDYDSYSSQTIDPRLIDSAIGTSIPSITDSNEDVVAEHHDFTFPSTALSSAEIDLGKQLLAALQKPVDTVPVDSDNMFEDCQNTSEFDDMFFGSQFPEYNANEPSYEDFATDPALDELMTYYH